MDSCMCRWCHARKRTPQSNVHLQPFERLGVIRILLKLLHRLIIMIRGFQTAKSGADCKLGAIPLNRT